LRQSILAKRSQENLCQQRLRLPDRKARIISLLRSFWREKKEKEKVVKSNVHGCC